jgi:putative restriction endonuclease
MPSVASSVMATRRSASARPSGIWPGYRRSSVRPARAARPTRFITWSQTGSGPSAHPLAPDLVESLHAEPLLLSQLAHVVLDDNFEPSLHDDICAAVGLDLEATDTGAGPARASRRRDPEFRRSILMAYEYRCAFCGYDGLLDGSMVGLEAAHVRWWTHGGPNQVNNGLCLCSIHHKLFDKGVLGVTSENKIAVSARFVGRSEAAQLLVISLSGWEANPPLKGFPSIASPHATWHTREVFRAPARAH